MPSLVAAASSARCFLGGGDASNLPPDTARAHAGGPRKNELGAYRPEVPRPLGAILKPDAPGRRTEERPH